jgi:hypothetical protein
MKSFKPFKVLLILGIIVSTFQSCFLLVNPSLYLKDVGFRRIYKYTIEYQIKYPVQIDNCYCCTISSPLEGLINNDSISTKNQTFVISYKFAIYSIYQEAIREKVNSNDLTPLKTLLKANYYKRILQVNIYGIRLSNRQGDIFKSNCNFKYYILG